MRVIIEGIDTGLPCDFLTSTCNGKAQLCIGFGPGKDMFDSTRIIGERQFNKAWVNSSTAIKYRYYTI